MQRARIWEGGWGGGGYTSVGGSVPEYRPDTACLNVILALTPCTSNGELFYIQLASQENLSDAAGGVGGWTPCLL